MQVASAAVPETSRQFISFTIGDEEYGIDIMAIREIKGWIPSTVLPETPLHIRGVINLRGSIIPIFDLRARFHGQLTDAAPRHVIIVVNVENRTMGLLVDAVADIITVGSDSIQPIPEIDHTERDKVLSGLVSVDDRMVALLDLAKLFHMDLNIDLSLSAVS